MGIKSLLTKKIVISFIIIISLTIVAVYFVNRDNSGEEYSTALAEKGSIIQTVSETGNIKATSELDLNFLNSGRVKEILVSVGEKAEKDQLLAELDYSTLESSREEAQANLDVATGNLNKLLSGATGEEIAVAKASVEQAKASYEASKKELERTKKTVQENIIQAEKTLSDLELQTESDLTTYEQAIITAQTSLNNTKTTYQNSINNYRDTALVTIPDKLAKANTALDTINTTINDEDAEKLISVKKPEYLANTTENYDQAVTLISEANSDLSLANNSKSETDVSSALDSTIEALNKVFSSLQNCFSALENSIISSDFTQTELDTFKSNISTQLSTIATAISAIQTAKNNLNDAIISYNTYVSAAEDTLAQSQASYDNALLAAKNALASAKTSGEQQITAAESKVDTTLESWQVAQAQLSQTVAPANTHDISLARAKIRQAQAALDSINKKIEDSRIIAPISGTITKIEYDVGEYVMPGGKSAISMLGENNFEIEVLISEADIAKIKNGDKAEVTLDAFGDDVKFHGAVFFIEPAETIIQDVIYYKVNVNFDPAERNVKSGMTANVVITTEKKDNVLFVPSRAIIEKNGEGNIVRVLENNNLVEKPVTIGLRGDEGITEILSGIEEGEIVVTYIKKSD